MPNDKRTRLLDAALYCFNRHGFQGVTTAAIAAEAGVATGTFFRYFPTKEALVASAYDHAELQLVEWVGAGPDYPRDTVYDVLRRAWTATAAKALAHPRAFRYWCLCWDTPGVPMRHADEHGPRRRLRPFQGVPQVLAAALGRPADECQLPAFALEGQWRAAIECVLAHPAWHAPDPRAAAALAQAFEAWWAGVGLDRAAAFPDRPAPVAP